MIQILAGSVLDYTARSLLVCLHRAGEPGWRVNVVLVATDGHINPAHQDGPLRLSPPLVTTVQSHSQHAQGQGCKCFSPEHSLLQWQPIWHQSQHSRMTGRPETARPSALTQKAHELANLPQPLPAPAASLALLRALLGIRTGHSQCRP